MADLITNLQSIYNTKLQIKDAIGTDSDIFADYPSYISDLKPAGYTYITTNGDHNVNAYSYVNVNVPGATEYDHIEISSNSQVNVAAYNYAYVSVPVPPGYIIPSGTINIDTVGTHDVTTYASAYVDIQIPTYVFGYQTITTNGTTYASSYGLDGFSYVDVQVPQSGSSHSGQSTADAWTIEDAYAYISAFEDTAEHVAFDLGFEPVVEGVVASVLPNRNYSSQYPTARFWITRDGSAVAADYSNAILCWNIQSNLAATWTEGIDMQIYPGQHVFIQCTKLQKYLDSNTGNYQMECKNGTAIVRQTSANGQLIISQSGTYDTTTYVSAYVNVSGGTTPDIMDESVQLSGKVVTLSYQYSFVMDPEMGDTITRVYPLLALKNVDSDTNYGAYTYLCNAPKEVTTSYVVSDMYLATNYVSQTNVTNGVVINTTGGSGHTDLNDEYYTGSEVSRDWFINNMDKGGSSMRTKYQYLKIAGNDPWMDPSYCYIFNKKIFGDIVDPNFAYGATVHICSNSDDPWVEVYSENMGMKENDCFVKYATDVSAIYSISDGWKLYKGYDISSGTLISDNWNLTQDADGYYVQVHVYNGSVTADRTFFITGNINGNECYYDAGYTSWSSGAFEKHTGKGRFKEGTFGATGYEAPDADGIFEISINQTTLECTFKFTPDA